MNPDILQESQIMNSLVPTDRIPVGRKSLGHQKSNVRGYQSSLAEADITNEQVDITHVAYQQFTSINDIKASYCKHTFLGKYLVTRISASKTDNQCILQSEYYKTNVRTDQTQINANTS